MVEPRMGKRAAGPALIWNVTSNVGPQQPNKLDDVELVRLGYYCMLKNPAGGFKDPNLIARVKQMKTSGPYDQNLGEIITLHETERGGAKDAIVSHGKEMATYDGKHTWIIYALSNNILDVYKPVWPGWISSTKPGRASKLQ